ncbi:MAG TPA: DNA topoisomerase IB [Thermomicrobiales bacterium]|nr:DNA topoisomerase IB [Thermomicrobiales bacterium]
MTVRDDASVAPDPVLITDPAASAKAAGLRYVHDDRPGITRKRAGKGFSYITPDGKRIQDKAERTRIEALAIPPAWTDVWICPDPRGHIQATGRDIKGRKQYRYHPKWREVRDETKYNRLMAFGQALPLIRERTEQDLRRHGLPREKVLATVIRLLETTLIRVGNEEYARTNESFGLTTMHDEHVDVTSTGMRFHFRGKGGIEHAVRLTDRRLAGIVRRCQELPGQELFQYLDDDGEQRTVDSADINAYLQEITGQDFTAKDFRTWAGTVLAAQALQELGEVATDSEAKQNILRAIEAVAARLGNTRTICRKCYVHPIVLETYADGTMLETVKQRAEDELAGSLSGLPPEEAAVLALLQRRLQIGHGASAA